MISQPSNLFNQMLSLGYVTTEKLYLDYKNRFSTIKDFAKYHNIPKSEALQLITYAASLYC